MKNKYELIKEARALADTLATEASPLKLKTAIIEKFKSFGIDDMDYSTFEDQVFAAIAQAQSLAAQLTNTEIKRLAAEIETKKSQAKETPSA